MTFRFIHTADWQLGRSFAQFEPGLAARLSDARIDVIERIAKVATDNMIGHVLVAGDVWDNRSPSDRLLRQPIDRMRASPSVTWWLIPGNHDPAEAHGLWDRLTAMDLPANIRPLTDATPVMMEDGVWLLPAPWTSKAPGRDLTSGFHATSTPAGALRIGLAHGGTSTFFDQSPQSAAIAEDRAVEADLDYLALGDWHGLQQVDTRTWYSGTPEPDRFPMNTPGHVLIVKLEKDAVPVVTPVHTGEYVWSRDRLQCQEGVDPCQEASDLFGAMEPRHRRLSRLELHGTLRLDARMKLLAFLERESHSLAHLRLKSDGLISFADVDSLDSIDREGTLRDAANSIAARMDDVTLSEQERVTARRALDYLATFAAGQSDT